MITDLPDIWSHDLNAQAGIFDIVGSATTALTYIGMVVLILTLGYLLFMGLSGIGTFMIKKFWK